MQIGNKIDNLKLFFVKVLCPIHHFFKNTNITTVIRFLVGIYIIQMLRNILFVMVFIKIIKITQPQLLAFFKINSALINSTQLW